MTHQETTQWVSNNLYNEYAEVLQIFVDYLYENGFTFDGEETVSYLGHDICLIHIYDQDDWWIYLIHDKFAHEQFPYDAEMTAFLQNQAKLNTFCGGGCAHCKTPEDFLLFGKKIENICKNVRVAFGKFNAERLASVAPGLKPELSFTKERMAKALKAFDMCKQIIEQEKST
jgi:hypothetical protein